MNQKLAKKTFVALAFAAAALPGFAQNAYVGGNIGSPDWKTGSISGISGDSKGTAYKLYGGYSFNPNFALEGGWADLGKLSGNAGATTGRGLFVDAVGRLPLANDFSAIGRVGVFNGKLSNPVNSGTGTDFKYGLGVQYDLSKNMALRGEWERYRFNALNIKPNVDSLSVGLTYGF
ncbi:MAG TPA: porin family protein [Methylibium sp.]